MGEFSPQEQNTFYNSRPKKLMGSMVWIENSEGKLLIAKPCYKKGWTLVGGLVDAEESPLQAAIREMHEETALQLPPERFKLFGFRYVSPNNGRQDNVQVFFKVQITDQEAQQIKLDSSELSEYTFISLEEVDKYTDSARMQAVAVLMRANPTVFYMHDERLV